MEQRTSSSPATPVRALVVEDDTLVAEVVAHELTERGVEVVGRANDGVRAVELTFSLRPDVVVMDIQMPGMDGLAASREIQQRCPTPVVILTVHDEPHTAQSAADAGVGAFLVKPANGDTLLRAIIVAQARFAELSRLRQMNVELEQTLRRVRTLSGMLPICAACKRVRNGDGAWQSVEQFIRAHSEAEFSHSICPTCAKALYPELESE